MSVANRARCGGRRTRKKLKSIKSGSWREIHRELSEKHWFDAAFVFPHRFFQFLLSFSYTSSEIPQVANIPVSR